MAQNLQDPYKITVNSQDVVVYAKVENMVHTYKVGYRLDDSQDFSFSARSFDDSLIANIYRSNRVKYMKRLTTTLYRQKDTLHFFSTVRASHWKLMYGDDEPVPDVMVASEDFGIYYRQLQEMELHARHILKEITRVHTRETARKNTGISDCYCFEAAKGRDIIVSLPAYKVMHCDHLIDYIVSFLV